MRRRRSAENKTAVLAAVAQDTVEGELFGGHPTNEHSLTTHIASDDLLTPEMRPLEPNPPGGLQLTGKIRSAAIWSGISGFVLRLSGFSVGVITARVIDPKQFGIFAVALTVYTVIINVSELGVSAALVRAKGNVDHLAPTVATLAVTSSVVLTTAMFLTAPMLATALGASQAAGAIRILSFAVLMGGITAVPYAMLVRDFRQDKRFIADGANFVVSTVAVIVLGLAGFGATALAVSRLVGLVASMILLIVMITPRYLPGWNRREARDVLNYSLPLAGASVVSFSLNNIDFIVVGRMRGALPLGYYNLAYNISGWPVSVFGLMINEVVLPAFAQARDDPRGLATRSANAFAVTAAVALPISGLSLALAHPLVVTVYGTRWAMAAGALAVLGVFGSIRIILTLLTNILAALGRSRSVLALQLVWIATLLPALIIGVASRGIVGAAIAQEVVALGIVFPIGLWLVARAGCGSPVSLLRGTTVPGFAALCSGGLAYGVTMLTETSWVKLVAGGAAGVAIYVVLAGPWLKRQLADAANQWNGKVG